MSDVIGCLSLLVDGCCLLLRCHSLLVAVVDCRALSFAVVCCSLFVVGCRSLLSVGVRCHVLLFVAG